eukprot:1954262-Pyramimonas_sp.AAC.1
MARAFQQRGAYLFVGQNALAQLVANEDVGVEVPGKPPHHREPVRALGVGTHVGLDVLVLALPALELALG